MSEPAKKRVVEYEKCLVSYTDILGFRELIKTESAGRISKLLRVFKEAHDVGHSPLKSLLPPRAFVNFSDLGITTIGLGQSAAKRKLSVTNTIVLQLFNLALGQISLIRNYEVVVRGGVSVGDAATSYRLVFGPGIVDAYELELKAVYPRIVVSKNVVDELRSGMEEDAVQETVGPLLATDEEGMLFIDYLGIIMKANADFLAVHRAFVEKQLKTVNPKERTKYEWLLAYHERTAARRADLEPG